MAKGDSTALTDKGIERLKLPASGRIERYDSRQPGLSLRVTPKGTRTWVVYFRVNGKPGKMTLGNWPAVEVADARKRAGDVREDAAKGVDPRTKAKREAEQAQREAEAEAERRFTFGQLVERYKKRELPKQRRGWEVEQIIDKRLLPEWQNKPLVDIRKRHAVELIEAIRDEEGKPTMARRVHEIVTRLFRYAHAKDLIEANPVSGMEPPAQKVARQRRLWHAEIKALWGAWNDLGYPYGHLQMLLLLTGQRREEVARMRWSELDDPDNPTVWTIPAERSKSAREHLVPLSEQARRVIADLPRFTGDYVFSSNGGKTPLNGFSKPAERTKKQTAKHTADEQPIADFRWHDYRRTCRSELARLKVPDTVAERVLNHAPKGLAKHYNVYEYYDEKADALRRWGAEVDGIVNPAPANVIRLEAADG